MYQIIYTSQNVLVTIVVAPVAPSVDGVRETVTPTVTVWEILSAPIRSIPMLVKLMYSNIVKTFC